MTSRRAKYQRKIEYILDKINDLPDQNYDSKYYGDIIFYRLHTSIQAIMDILAMLCKDFGITVRDDYTNIEELNEKHLFSSDLIGKLQKLNGLRNALVHKYNHVENSLIEQDKGEIVADIHTIIETVEKIINDNPEFISDQSD